MKRCNTKKTLLIFGLIMFVSMFSSLVISIVAVNKISIKNNKTDNTVLAAMISNSIDNCFVKPIAIAETMANDYCLQADLKKSSVENAEDCEKEIAAYLKQIQERFGYESTFAVSEKSKAYYSPNGITKYINSDFNTHDSWYKRFINSKQDYVLDVDNDEVNHRTLSVFVNAVSKDQDQNILGVVGIGVKMARLQMLIADFEEEYNVKINLVDENGLIKGDKDGFRIDTAYLDCTYFDRIPAGKYYYDRVGDGSRVTYYMENLNWYLVVTDNNIDNIGVEKIVTPSVLIFIIGLVFMFGAAYVISSRDYTAV